MSEGAVVPYNELPESEQNDLMAWVRQEKERMAREDPIIQVRLLWPDGSTADNEIHEMRTSLAEKMNDERAFAYLRSRRNREKKILAYEAALKTEVKSASEQWKAMKAMAEEASTAAIPTSNRELRDYRREHKVIVKAPEPRAIAKPDLAWTRDDALWFPCEYTGTGLIRHDDF